jgi:ADP-heptose:LPS heptosyltransferase
MHIVLIKPDGIGDYFLYRNFPPLIKKHFGPDCQLTGILKPPVRGLADVIDGDVWDRILWLEPQRLIDSWSYRMKWRVLAKTLKADLVLYPVISRCSPVDWLVSKIPAQEKVGSVNDLKCMSPERSRETDHFYTRLIRFNPNRPRLEFWAYQDFIRTWLGIEPPETATVEPSRLPEVELGLDQYAMLFPGAGQENREWPPERFGALARYLVDEHNLDVLIAGPVVDAGKAGSIMAAADRKRVHSVCGNHTMAGVAAMVAGARLVVSNDSAPFHLAAALRVPFVMISSTRDYGRYHPYPPEFQLHARYVYPPNSDVWPPEKETYEHMKKVHEEAKPNHVIADVTLDQVIRAVDEVVKDCRP